MSNPEFYILAPDVDRSIRTRVSNEQAIKQFVNKDKTRVLSIIQSGKFFRFVEDCFIYEPATASVPSYSYWDETHRSGTYENALSAESEALACVAWLHANNSN